MAKFVLVDTVPTSLGKEEMLINEPDFAEEVKASNFKASGRKWTSQNHLQQIVTLIKNKYDPEGELNTNIPYSRYSGLPYATNEDIGNLIHSILTKHCPSMIDRAVEFSIKNRPAGVKVIYFKGPSARTNIFFRHGIAGADLKEAQNELTTKKNKNKTEED